MQQKQKHFFSLQSPSQNRFLSSTGQRSTNLLILLTNPSICIACHLRFRRPDLPPLGFLTLKVLRDDVADRALEEQWRLLILGVKLTTRKNISVEVLLSVVAEDFVFTHDARVHVTDKLEVGIGGVSVSVDFVGHLRAFCA